MDAFGYAGQPGIYTLRSMQVSEAKAADTLQPAVVLSLTVDESPDARVRVAMPPDMADQLAAELQRWAARAREKHWE